MHKLVKVAKRDKDSHLRWESWKKVSSILHYKKLYKTKPEKFIETNGTLYIKLLDPRSKERIRTLLHSCLKIAGSKYALALTLADGNRQSKAFYSYYDTIKNGVFRDRIKWIDILQTYIKKHAVKTGVIDDGSVHWLDQSEILNIKLSVIKTYYSEKPELFERIDNLLFFLPTQNILLENMFFKCTEIAGGEYALAREISRDEKEKNRHLKNFERMQFKHRENFKCYALLFSKYLEKNRSLFSEDSIDA